MTIRRVETPTPRALPTSSPSLEVKTASAEELKKNLSAEQVRSLDVNGDGQLAQPEAAAALAAADVNSDNFVDKGELAQLGKLLGNGASAGVGLDSNFGQSGLASRARSSDREAQVALQGASTRLATETAKLGSAPVPTESAQLIGERANALREKLPDLPPALERAKADVAQARAALTRFDADTARLQTKVDQGLKQLYLPADLEKASQGLQSKMSVRQETMKQLQAQLAAAPAPAAGVSGSERASLQERLTYLEGVVEGYDSSRGSSPGKRFVDNARTEITQLQAKLNPPHAQTGLQKRIGEIQREVEELKGLKTNVDTLRAAPAVREKYTAPIPGAEAKVGQLEKALSDAKAEFATLQAQLPVAEAREALAPVELRAVAASRLAVTASAGEAAVAQGNKALEQVRANVGGARAELEVVKGQGFGTLKDTLQKTRWLEQEVNSGRIDRDDINMQWVDWSNRVIGEHVGRHFEQLEGQSKKLIQDFERPEVRAAITRLPKAEREALLKDFSSLLSETNAGRAYLDGPLARQQQAVYAGQGSATDRELLGGENGGTLNTARSRGYNTDYTNWQRAGFSPDSQQAKAIEQEFQSGRVTAGKVLAEVPGVIADAAVALKDTGAAAIQFLKEVEEGLDYEKNIKALGEGDSYELKLGLKGSVEVQAGAEVTVKVKKEEGKYKVDLSGDVEVGLNAFNTGAQVGPAKAGWNAEVNAKGGVTLGTEFNTPEEAIAFLKTNPAFADLKKYATSVELHGGIAAQVEGGLGLGDKKQQLLGAYGSAGGELQTKVAINFKNPPELVIGYQVEGTANAGVAPSSSAMRRRRAASWACSPVAR